MMCCGVLPIDTVRDYITPLSLILSRVPKEVIEAFYKIKLPKRESVKYNAYTFL
jgi:large subunit GTPase 1